MGTGNFTPDQRENIDELDAELDVEALGVLAKIAFDNYKAAANEHTNYRLYDKENPPQESESEKQYRKDKLAALKREEDLAKLEWDKIEQLSEEKKR